MPKKYIERFNNFKKSLQALERMRYRDDLTDEYTMSGAVQKFDLTFDISWKVMKDIIVNYHKISDYATGSPRETLRMAERTGIIDDDIWMHMLKDRNELTHDYDGSLAEEAVYRIRDDYLPVFEKFRDKAEWYMREMEKEAD